MDSKVTKMALKVTNMDSASNRELEHRGGDISTEKTLIGTMCEKEICKNCFEYFSDFNRFMSETVTYFCTHCGTMFVPPGIANSEKLIEKIKQIIQDVPESKRSPSVPYNVGSHDKIAVQRSPSPQFSVKSRNPSDDDDNDDDAYVAVIDNDDDDNDRALVLNTPNNPVHGVKTFITGAVSSTPIVTTSKRGKPLVRLSVPKPCEDSELISGNVFAKQGLKPATVQSFSNLLKSSDVTKFYVRVETAPEPSQKSSKPVGPVKEGMTSMSEGVHKAGTELGRSSQVVLQKDIGDTEKCVVLDSGNPGIPERKNQPDGKTVGRFKSRILPKDTGHPQKRTKSHTSIPGIKKCKNQLKGQSVIKSKLKVLLKDIRHKEECVVSDSSSTGRPECKNEPESESGRSSEQGLPSDMSDTEECALSDTSVPNITGCKYLSEMEPYGGSEQRSEDTSGAEEFVMSDACMPDITEGKYKPEGEPGRGTEKALPEDMSDTEECGVSDNSIPDIIECKNQPEGDSVESTEHVLLKYIGQTEKCVMSGSGITGRSECNTKPERKSGRRSEESLPEDISNSEECPLPSNCIPVTVAIFEDTVATKESPKAETGNNSAAKVFEDKEPNRDSPSFTSNEPDIVEMGSSVQVSMEHTGHLENSSLCKNYTVRNVVPKSASDVENTENIESSDLKCQMPIHVQDKIHNVNPPVVCKNQHELHRVTYLSAVPGITDSDDVELPMQVKTDEKQFAESAVSDVEVNVYNAVKGEEEHEQLSCSESDSFMDTLELGFDELNRKTQSGSVDHSYSHQSKKTPVARVTKFPRQKSAYKMTSATKIQCGVCRKTFPSSSKCFEHVRKVHFLVGTHFNIKQRGISRTRAKLRVESGQVKTSEVTEEVSQELTSQLAPEAYLDAGLMAKLTEAGELRHNFVCGVCKEGFMNIEMVNQHSQMQHPGELVNVIEVQHRHVCEFCGKEEETKAKLQCHRKTHYRCYNIVCELCKEEFCDIAAVHLHAKTVHPLEKFVSVVKKRRTFKCNVCGKKVMSKHSLDQHMRIHTGECPYVCDICGKRAKTRGSILSHKRRIHPTEEDKIAKAHQPTFTCPVCHKEVKSKTSLGQHMRLHTGEKPYQCGACGKCYASNSAVHCHIRRVHIMEQAKPKENTVVTCEECGKQLTSKSGLRKHMLIHTGERPHVCPQCDRRFRTNSHLKVHIRKHTGKQFKCEECGKAYSERYMLKQHMNVHTREQSDQCTYCGKVFYDKSVFKQHVRKVHERGDKYQCNVCNKSLNSGFSLREHMRVHSGERPHSCNVCSLTFKTLSACRAHEKRHSIVGNLYECPKCSKGFRTKHGFQKHVRNNCCQGTGNKFKEQLVKKFQCVYCEKKYFSEEKLRKHTARHVVESSSEEEEPTVLKSSSNTKCYSCSQCEKQYKTARGLRKHKEKHEKEEDEEGVSESEDEKAPSFMQESSRKQYECGHCGKEYKNKKSLKEHELKHVEELSSENENDKGNVEEESLLDDWNI